MANYRDDGPSGPLRLWLEGEDRITVCSTDGPLEVGGERWRVYLVPVLRTPEGPWRAATRGAGTARHEGGVDAAPLRRRDHRALVEHLEARVEAWAAAHPREILLDAIDRAGSKALYFIRQQREAAQKLAWWKIETERLEQKLVGLDSTTGDT